MLDEVILCLEKVLAGVEVLFCYSVMEKEPGIRAKAGEERQAKEVEEQPVDKRVKVEEVGELILDKKGWMEWNQKKKSIARKIGKENYRDN